jgi:predicted Zn finger-like uncharacterized protein
MIIQCKSCLKKFIVKDIDIPAVGRNVQCGYCSVTWLQLPITAETESLKLRKIKDNPPQIKEGLSVDAIKASDGKTYKFLGTQWALLLPSGKTGLFAKRKIGKELDEITGRKKHKLPRKKKKKIDEVNPAMENQENEQKLPTIYQVKEGLGFFGFIFLFIIILFSIVGILKTFETDLINYFPDIEYIFQILDEQLIYISEAVKNIITIIDDLINFY